MESRTMLAGAQDVYACFVDTAVIDFNLDGGFDSSDLVQAFSNTGNTWNPTSPESYFFASDFVHAMQSNWYESENSTGCQNMDTHQQHDVHQVTQRVLYPDGRSLQELTTTYWSSERMLLRSSEYWTNDGVLQTVTHNRFNEDQTTRVRVQKDFNRDRQVVRETTQVFFDDGSLRRMGVVNYHRISSIHKTTDQTQFSKSGERLWRLVTYYSDQNTAVASELYRFESDVPVSLTSSKDGPTEVRRISEDSFNIQAAKLNEHEYWIQLRELLDATLRHSSGDFSRVLEMNWIPAQRQLTELLRISGLSSYEASVYRNLNAYFHVMKHVTEAYVQLDLHPLYERFSNVIDASTGDWKNWFVRFTNQEGLTLPMAPWRLEGRSNDLTDDRQRFSKFVDTFGPNPVAFFQPLWESSGSIVDGILESMRKVKSKIKLLEYQARGETPVFEWINVVDAPDFEQVLNTPEVGPMTSWHFFTRNENGQYETDNPNEELTGKRIRKYVTDEDKIYVMNIEYWDLNHGDAQTIEQNIEKLKRTADLVHKFNPNLLIGYYRLLPRRDPSVSFLDPDGERYLEWQAHNDLVASRLEDSIDIIYPSLYPMHLGRDGLTTQEYWATYAEHNLQEARRVADGKPVIPFLSLYYHSNGGHNPKGWDFIEPELLLYQMAKLDELADGMVLYNDLRVSWQTLEALNIAAAINSFMNVQRQGRLPQLREHFHRLFDQHRDELLYKQDVEVELINKQYQLGREPNAAIRAKLSHEIAGLQRELERLINLFHEVVDF